VQRRHRKTGPAENLKGRTKGGGGGTTRAKLILKLITAGEGESLAAAVGGRNGAYDHQGRWCFPQNRFYKASKGRRDLEERNHLNKKKVRVNQTGAKNPPRPKRV